MGFSPAVDRYASRLAVMQVGWMPSKEHAMRAKCHIETLSLIASRRNEGALAKQQKLLF